ncbi:hypothetical protein [Microvirga sp. 2TAF3]|uniref:hypothetical protein n=1 Tax=Microvirga sp. 2TAF3 TaxID=3233014 RepID=UPI003F9E6F35
MEDASEPASLETTNGNCIGISKWQEMPIGKLRLVNVIDSDFAPNIHFPYAIFILDGSTLRKVRLLRCHSGMELFMLSWKHQGHRDTE